MKRLMAFFVLFILAVAIPSHAQWHAISPGLPDDTAMNSQCVNMLQAARNARWAEKQADEELAAGRAERAFCWEKAASDLGSLAARERIANFYMTGVGVERNTTFGLRYLRSAADAKRVSAQWALVSYFSEHDKVASADDRQGAYWCGVLKQTPQGRALLAEHNKEQAEPFCYNPWMP